MKTTADNFTDFNYLTDDELEELLQVQCNGERYSTIDSYFNKESSVKEINIARQLNNKLFLLAVENKDAHLMSKYNHRNMVYVEALYKMGKIYHCEVNKRLREKAIQVNNHFDFLVGICDFVEEFVRNN